MKWNFNSASFLTIYSAVLTAVLPVSMLGGSTPKKTSFEEITVQRVNVVEPNGTLRMVISDKSRLPGIIIKGREHPHPNRHTAGILFFNDEGTENGGLSFGGSKERNGQARSSGHLSFDAYEQDQYFSIDADQLGDQTSQSLRFVDRPDYPIDELVAVLDQVRNLPADQQRTEMATFTAAHPAPHQRLYIGRGRDGAVALKLKDAEGRDRIVIQVGGADGSPVIQLLGL